MRQVAHISDIHFGADDPAAVAALRDDLLATPYDLLVVSGDFTQRARPTQFRRAMRFLADLPGPHLYVPGNHDVPLFNVARRVIDPYGNYARHVTADLSPRFADDELLVLGLNTARAFAWTLRGFWKDGRISATQLLDVHLAAAEAGAERFTLVVTHHPFLPPPDARSHGAVMLEDVGGPSGRLAPQVVRGSTRALRTLESVGVELLLAGHLHMNYSGDVRSHHERVARSILSIQAGTACSYRRRGEPNAYNRITIGTARHDALPRDRVIVGIRALHDGVFRDAGMRAFEKYPDGWR